MENKSGKIIAIVALAVAVVALSVGFAAFADTLTIDGTATANATSTNVFDDETNGLSYTGTPSCVYQGTSDSAGNAGTFTNNNDSWSGISVNLTDTASTVVCTATITNKTAYQAHITGLSTSGGLTCASTGANAATNQTNVCGATSVAVSISDGTHGADTMTITNAAASASTSNTIVAPNNGTATVTVTITYAGSTADQDTTITIPTITHTYSSANS